MKLIFAFLMSVVCIPTQAKACTDFTGEYRQADHDGEFNKIEQSGCEKIMLTTRTGVRQPSATFVYYVDGKRYADTAKIYWVASWDGASFYMEPWTAETGGELMGDREVWTLIKNAGVVYLEKKIVDTNDGSTISSRLLQKTK